jgi:integrase
VPLLSAATADYLDYRILAAFRENTVRNDKHALSRLYKSTGDIQLSKITPASIDDLLGGMLKSREYAIGTINATHSSLSAFFRWCRTRGHVLPSHDPLAGRRYIPTPPVGRLYIPLHEFPVVLDAATKPRDRALIAAGFYTLCRQSELVTLRVRDLDLGSGRLSVLLHKTYGSDEMPVSAEFDEEMRLWLLAYQEEVGRPLDPDWLLFPAMATSGYKEFKLAPTSKISRSSTIVRRVLESAGYEDKRLGVHTLRRSSARALFDELSGSGYDGSLRLVSSMLHHSSTVTTEKYLSLDLDKERRNEKFQGASLFPSLRTDNIVPIRKPRSA